jgi:hypothetical protein
MTQKKTSTTYKDKETKESKTNYRTPDGEEKNKNKSR